VKKIVALLLVALSFGAFAQDKKLELTPEQKLIAGLYVAEGVSALVLGPVILPVATLAGKKEELCKAMKGKFDLTAADQCAGGSWLRLIPILRGLRD
jgi:hypothetical protein